MRLLIVKTSSLGDIIHTFPALQYLRQKFPSAQIDWVVEKPFAELVKAHPAIDNVFCIDTKAWRKRFFKRSTFSEIFLACRALRTHPYDLVFDFQGNTKSGLITSIVKGKAKIGFGRQSVSEWPNLLFTTRHFDPPAGKNIRSDLLFLPQSYLKDFAPYEVPGIQLQINQEQKLLIKSILQQPALDKKCKIMVCPGSAWPNKQINPTSLADLLQLIHKELDCYFLLVWGNAEEKERAKELHALFPEISLVIERLTLPVLQNLMNEMDWVLAMDSLPLHLAGTTRQKPSVFLEPP